MNEDIGFKVRKLSTKIKYLADENLKEHDLTIAQVRILHYLDNSGGSCMQKEIEKSFGVSHPTIVGIISRLQKNGYIEVFVDENDRRNRIVKATKKADDFKKQAQEELKEHEAILSAGFNEEELTLLRSMLLRMIENVQQAIDEKRCKE